MFHFQVMLCSCVVSKDPQPEVIVDTLGCAWQKVQCVSASPSVENPSAASYQ